MNSDGKIVSFDEARRRLYHQLPRTADLGPIEAQWLIVDDMERLLDREMNVLASRPLNTKTLATRLVDAILGGAIRGLDSNCDYLESCQRGPRHDPRQTSMFGQI